MVSFGLKKVAIFGLMSLALCAQDAAFARKATPPQPPIEKAELEANLPAPLAKAAKDFKIPLSAMAISVRALDGSAKPILSVNGQHPVAPASTEKLITTLAALELLGPDYHWITRFLRISVQKMIISARSTCKAVEILPGLLSSSNLK